MNRNGNHNALANPSQIKPVDGGDEALVKVIIETPKGSRNKYAFDAKERVFVLKKVLPSGMTFPYDFGFVPQTEGGDGDPLDVLVLMDEPAFPGCVVISRLIGVIEGEQGKGKELERNDRIVAIEAANHTWANVNHIDDLGKEFIEELEAFFTNYHELSRKQYRVLDCKGPKAARKCLTSGMKAVKKAR